jgi:hypothetical protein
MENLTCPGCGNTLNPGANFCPYCGLVLKSARADGRTDDPAPSGREYDAEGSASQHTTVEQPSKTPQHEIARKSGFRWWYIIIITLLISGIIYIFYQPGSSIVNEFKSANAAAGWQFTAYMPQSFARIAGGLTLYNGIYVYKESYQDMTVTLNASIKTDIAIEQNGYLCIWLRYNPGISKGYCFILKPVTRTVHLGIAGDPNPQSVDLNQLMPNFNPYQMHSYTASARGENLQFAIDGRQVASLYDVGLIKGQVALEARGLGVTIAKAEITPER